MSRTLAIAIFVLTIPILTACSSRAPLVRPASSEPSATSPYPTVGRPVASCGANEKPFDCDRRAILAMLGGYEVQFKFDETVVLKPGYERRQPKRSMGFEYVILVEDSGNKISLQHILVMGGGAVTKHWRQDWIYESPKNWVYVGHLRFEQRKREPASVPGTWTQLVYEVNDGPRYSGSGKWNHRYGVSTWTSERSWRPLPRREYTQRSDYQLINTENRHTITPQGWTHEQDSTKVLREKGGKDEVLVREFGFNEYRRIDGYDFAPARNYWKETSEFWSHVRARWEKEFSARGSITLSVTPGDETFNKMILELADDYRKNPRWALYQEKVEEAFNRFVNVNPAASAAQR